MFKPIALASTTLLISLKYIIINNFWLRSTQWDDSRVYRSSSSPGLGWTSSNHQRIPWRNIIHLRPTEQLARIPATQLRRTANILASGPDVWPALMPEFEAVKGMTNGGKTCKVINRYSLLIKGCLQGWSEDYTVRFVTRPPPPHTYTGV